MYRVIPSFCALMLLSVGAFAQKTPTQVGRLVAEDLLNRDQISFVSTEPLPDHPHLSVYVNPSIGYRSTHYAEACTGFGVLRFAQQIGDKELIERVHARYQVMLEEGPRSTGGHVDANVYGILPLEIYLQTGDKAFLVDGLRLADLQWEEPREDGLPRDSRFWIDDMWMIASLQTEAFRATQESRYLDRAAIVLEKYAERLQQPNGLFFHGENARFFWGRGNGWVAAALAFTLSYLPQDHPRYDKIKGDYLEMMAALRRYQTKDGMWRQLITTPEAWVETSSTAMFGYAMTAGVRIGILEDPAYRAASDKAWGGLAGYLNDKGQMTKVCEGTSKSQDINYYLARPRITGDLHGQAPTLWFAAERIALTSQEKR